MLQPPFANDKKPGVPIGQIHECTARVLVIEEAGRRRNLHPYLLVVLPHLRAPNEIAVQAENLEYLWDGTHAELRRSIKHTPIQLDGIEILLFFGNSA